MGTTKRFTKESGMTLLEITFAGAVMAITLSFLFGTLINVSAVGVVTEQRTIAVTHLSSVMEEIQGLPISELTNYEAPYLRTLGPMESVGVYIMDGDTPIQLPVSLTSLPAGLANPLPVRVVVSWYDPQGRTMSVQATKLVQR